MSENVKAFVTSLGATIIAYLKEETDTEYCVENALFVVPQQDQQSRGVVITFSPISIFSKDNPQHGLTCNLNKSSVILTHEVREDIKQNYCQVVGKIAVVPAGAIQMDGLRRK